MKRFVLYNPNPHAARVGDCAVRAVSKALGLPWETAYIQMALEGFLRGDMPSANHVWGGILQRNGFVRKSAPCTDCYSVRSFAEDHPRGTFVLGLSGHTVCVVDGQYFDTWDSGEEPISYYWQKGE